MLFLSTLSPQNVQNEYWHTELQFITVIIAFCGYAMAIPSDCCREQHTRRFMVSLRQIWKEVSGLKRVVVLLKPW